MSRKERRAGPRGPWTVAVAGLVLATGVTASLLGASPEQVLVLVTAALGVSAIVVLFPARSVNGSPSHEP